MGNIFFTLNKIIEFLNTSSLFSGLIGTLVGGYITYRVTSNSLEKQFKYQVNLIRETEKKKELVALKLVKNEMIHNLAYLNSAKKTMDENKIDFIDYKKSGCNIMLKNDKWEKYEDVIESIESIENIFYLKKLQWFYIVILVEIREQVASKERIEGLIKQAEKLIEQLEESIRMYGYLNIKEA